MFFLFNSSHVYFHTYQVLSLQAHLYVYLDIDGMMEAIHALHLLMYYN
jgi:hypothetical protein